MSDDDRDAFLEHRDSLLRDGIGLVDIEANPDAIVLIGRHRDVPESTTWQRRAALRDERILVHTYDELIALTEHSERISAR